MCNKDEGEDGGNEYRRQSQENGNILDEDVCSWIFIIHNYPLGCVYSRP